MVKTSDAQTRQQSLYLWYRQSLLRGEFAMGHRLKLNELSESHGVSVGVVREALTRLATQGLLRAESNKGFSVPILTLEEVNDLAFVRGEVESLTVRLSVERGGPEWEASVVAAHHRLSLTPNVSITESPEANDRWTEVHRSFHEACTAGCGSPRLMEIRATLYDQAEIIRQIARLRSDGTRDVAGEHRSILEVILAREPETAAEQIRRHVDTTRRQCVEAWVAGSGSASGG